MADQAKMKTAAEQADDIRLRRELILLEKEELELEEVRETTAQRKAQKAQKAQKHKMSQQTLAVARNDARNLANACRHRQGGENGNIYKGKGPTSLKVEKMPDGFTVVVHCLNCPLWVTNPIPSDASKKMKPDETAKERDARLVKYAADKAQFDELYRISQDRVLTNTAAQPLECGTTFKVINEEGMQIFKRRPSDSYAIGYDNIRIPAESY